MKSTDSHHVTASQSTNNGDRNLDIGSENEEVAAILVEHDRNSTVTSCSEENTNEKEKNKLVSPDGGWGWAVVMGCFLSHFISGGMLRSSGLIFVQLRDIYQESASATSWVLSLSSVLTLLLGPLASALSNRFSVRSVVIVGGIVTALGFGLSIFCTSLGQTFLTLGVIRGIGNALIYSPGLVIVNQYFNKRRGIAVGISVSGTGIATFALPPCIELMFENYGFRGTMLLLSGFSLNLCVCGALYRPLEQTWKLKNNRLEVTVESEKLCIEKYNEASDGKDLDERHVDAFEHRDEDSLQPNTRTHENKVRSSVLSCMKIKVFGKNKNNSASEKKKILDLSLLKNVHFVVTCSVNGILSLGFLCYMIFTPEVAISNGLSELEAAYGLSAQGIADTFSRVIFGVILDLKKVKYYRLLAHSVTLLFLSVCFFTIPFLTSVHTLAAVCGCIGVLTGIYLGQKTIAVIDVLGPDKISSSLGLLLCFQGLGALIGPPLAGYLRDASDNYNITYYFVSTLVLCGFVTLFTTHLVFRYCKNRCNCFRVK